MNETKATCDRKAALVVDDDEICRLVTAEILDNLGIAVHLAPGAEHAVNLAKANTYDLFLLDLNMPTVSGLELGEILLESGLATEDRVFLLTGEEPDSAVTRKCAGMSLRVIHKPIERAWIESFFSGQSAPPHSAKKTVRKTAQIQGFDIPRALTNFMGYESAYFNILREFPAYGANFISEFASYLRSKNFKECRRLAHSIKGSSLMIGATELNALAAELESACLIEPDADCIRHAFGAVEEKILQASDNVKKHFQLIDNA